MQVSNVATCTIIGFSFNQMFVLPVSTLLGYLTPGWINGSAYRISVWKHLGRRLDDNIKVDFRKIGLGTWLNLARNLCSCSVF